MYMYVYIYANGYLLGISDGKSNNIWSNKQTLLLYAKAFLLSPKSVYTLTN